MILSSMLIFPERTLRSASRSTIRSPSQAVLARACLFSRMASASSHETSFHAMAQLLLIIEIAQSGPRPTPYILEGRPRCAVLAICLCECMLLVDEKATRHVTLCRVASRHCVIMPQASPGERASPSTPWPAMTYHQCDPLHKH